MAIRPANVAAWMGATLAPGPAATGRLEHEDGVAWLTYSRSFDCAVDRLWSMFVEPEHMSRWVGVSVGRSEDGVITFLAGGEGADEEPVRYRVLSLTPLVGISVAMLTPTGAEAWLIKISLGQIPGGSTLRVSQAVSDPSLAPSVGPSVDYYLDRLGVALAGGDVNSLRFDDYFVAQARYYRKMFPLQRKV